jgi:hypothetical protein
MFFGMVAEPGSLSFHLRQEAKLENSGVPFITARYDLDVAGADFAGQASAEGMGIEVAFELVGVDERAWLRIADGDWNEADYESVGAEDVLDIWRYVASRESLELEDIDADGDYVFESAARMPYETGAMRDSGMIGEITQQVLVLTPDGVPVSLELWIEARGTVGQQVLDVTGTTSVEFSRWGEPITIEAPSS